MTRPPLPRVREYMAFRHSRLHDRSLACYLRYMQRAERKKRVRTWNRRVGWVLTWKER